MIKIDMNMPDCCTKCPFYSGGYLGGSCLADPYNSLYFGNMHVEVFRHSGCPLQEVDEND